MSFSFSKFKKYINSCIHWIFNKQDSKTIKPVMLKYFPSRQCFALPRPFITYLMKHGNTIVCKKLLQSCQYFFLRQRVYPFQHVIFGYKTLLEYAACYDKKEPKNDLLPKGHFHFDYSNAPFKLTVNHTLVLCRQKPGFSKTAEQLLPKIYKCNLKDLRLGHQHISYNDYLFLTESKTITQLIFHKNIITYDNGDLVPFEDILKEVPNVEKVYYIFHCDLSQTGITESTMKNLLQLPRFKSLLCLRLYELPEMITPQSFISFVKKQEKRCCYKLWWNLSKDTEEVGAFNKAFTTIINEWKNENTKPKLFAGRSRYIVID